MIYAIIILSIIVLLLAFHIYHLTNKVAELLKFANDQNQINNITYDKLFGQPNKSRGIPMIVGEC
jgi:hypothetical protein